MGLQNKKIKNENILINLILLKFLRKKIYKNIKNTIGINENLSDETYAINIGIKLLFALRFSSKIHVIKIIKPKNWGFWFEIK